MNRLRIAVVGKEGSGMSTDTAERQALRAQKPDGRSHFLICPPAGRGGPEYAVQTPIFSDSERSEVSSRRSTLRAAINAPRATPARPARITPVAE